MILNYSGNFLICQVSEPSSQFLVALENLRPLLGPKGLDMIALTLLVISYKF